jgi:hypothetical protein
MQCCYRTSEVLVLFDPLIPADEPSAYWEFLEDRRGCPGLPDVLTTRPFPDSMPS